MAWDVLSNDAGVPPDSSGVRGLVLSYIVRSKERVDALLAEAERAGGTIVEPAQETKWGGLLVERHRALLDFSLFRKVLPIPEYETCSDSSILRATSRRTAPVRGRHPGRSPACLDP